MKQIVLKTSVVALVCLGLFTSCTITMTTSKAVGEQIKLKMNADEDQKKNVWIDLNNNGKKDNGEVVTKFDEYVDYTIGSQTIDLHGGIKSLTCMNNQMTSIISKNTELEVLDCGSNELKVVDVSGSKKLTRLLCEANQLTQLDVSKNPELKILYCYNNQFSELDVSKNGKLECLLSHSNPNMTKLNMANGNNKNFKFPWSQMHPAVRTSDCPKLKCIQVDKGFDPNAQTGKKEWVKDATAVWNNSGTPCEGIPTATAKITMTTTKAVGDKIKLRTYAEVANQAGVWIDLNNNGKKDSDESVTNFWNDEEYELKSQTITVYGKVTNLNCSKNKLTQLDVSKNTELEELYSQDNNLTELNVRNNTKLTLLDCGDNNLTELDVRNCRQLVYLYCYATQLTQLNISNCTKLEYLQCNKSKLTSLDVSNCTKLKLLSFGENQLKTIDLSKCKELYELSCSNNKLTFLDVSKNIKLENLYCRMNKLTTLDVSGNTQLKQLLCTNNQLTVLDVSVNKNLRKFWCSNNPNLTRVNVANGHNSDFNGGHHTNPAFDAIGCSKLKCIKVDKGFDPDAQISKKKWKKDNTASWRNDGTDCP